MNIIISNTAHQNIRKISQYVAKTSYKNAIKTVDNIYLKISNLKFSPYIGRYVPELEDKHFRELIYKNYRILYTIHNNYIQVHFVISRFQNIKFYFNH